MTACSGPSCPSGDPATSPAPSPSATADADGLSAAREAAETLLTTWSRPTMAYEPWWAELKPLLSPEGQASYEFTDPANIPDLKITGPGKASNAGSPYLATVTFATTQGEFGVDLSRTAIPGKWIAENIIFPGDFSRLQG